MELHKFLEENKSHILNEAAEALHRAQLKSYSLSSIEQNKDRLEKLFDYSVICVKSKNLVGMTEYADKIAKERFNAGFDLHEVHTVFNVLEETIWKKNIR